MMDCWTKICIGLTMILQAANGQGISISTINLTISNSSTNGSTNGLVTTTATTLVTPTVSPLTTTNNSTNGSTNGSVNTTATTLVSPSAFPLTTSNSSTNGSTNATQPPLPVSLPTFSLSCASDPPLCCLGLNSSCNRGCYCDVACLRLNDCCSDFRPTCVTGFETSNFTNTTSNNETSTFTNTTSSNNNNNNQTTFPVFTFSGNCSSGPLCCSGPNLTCFNGCFCDQSCVDVGDCCPDFNDVCMNAFPNITTPVIPTTNPPALRGLVSFLSISLLAPPRSTDRSRQQAIEQALLELQEFVKNNTGEDIAFRILTIQPT